MTRNAERGFTLLEVLLAVFLLALMMGIVYGVVISTVQAQERVEELTLGTEIGPAVMNQIRQDLEAAIIRDKETDWFFGGDRKGSTGDRDRIDFVAAVTSFGAEDPQSEPRFHTINEVGYQVQDSRDHPGEGALYRREDFWFDEEPLKGGRITELCDRVSMFDVQYWDGSKWVSDWSSRKSEGKLPEAFKVTLKIKLQDRFAEGGVVERTFGLTVSLPK